MKRGRDTQRASHYKRKRWRKPKRTKTGEDHYSALRTNIKNLIKELNDRDKLNDQLNNNNGDHDYV